VFVQLSVAIVFFSRKTTNLRRRGRSGRSPGLHRLSALQCRRFVAKVRTCWVGCVAVVVSTCRTTQRLHCHSAIYALQTNAHFRDCFCDPLQRDFDGCLDVQKRIFHHSCIHKNGLLRFASDVDDAKCILVTRHCVFVCVCLSVYISVCLSPHSHTAVQTRM